MTTATAADGRARELAEAYREHRDDLLAFARRRLHDASLAEDVVQDTFVRAWRSQQRFDPAAGTMRMWLFTICRNATADAARARTRRMCNDQAAATGRWDDDPGMRQLAARWDVHELLRRLPGPQRDAIVEVHLRERSYGDVARDFGVPVGTLKSRVCLGLRSARAALTAV